FRPYWLFTSLLNPASAPAAELATLYHERWELELAFDELKTHTLDRAEALRSKAPARIEQQVWGLLLAYNLARLVISRAAPRASAPPPPAVVRPPAPPAPPPRPRPPSRPPRRAPPPRRIELLPAPPLLCPPPPPRPRRYPRAVKLKISRYLRKRPTPLGSRAK